MAEHLYLHVPFCKSICYYCDFCHVAYNEKTADRWLNALEEEFSLRTFSKNLKTIYIGGGTPSSLDEERLERVLRLLVPYQSKVEEYTIEVNPETLTKEKAALFAKYGINRISMGLQTSNDKLLSAIGRRHTFADVKEAMRLLHDAGITNISLDIMYGLPGQDLVSVKKSVKDAIDLNPKHISLYSLTIEENSVFGKRGVQPCDSDLEADMYDWIVETLPQYGYRQYEISNFALPGYESLHNKAYWYYKDFYGVSCGASGKEEHKRYDNTANIMAYCDDPLLKDEIVLTKEDEAFEMIMMSLRLVEGLDLKRYEQLTGESFDVHYGEKSALLMEEGLLEKSDDHVRATKYGMKILNSVLVALMDD